MQTRTVNEIFYTVTGYPVPPGSKGRYPTEKAAREHIQLLRGIGVTVPLGVTRVTLIHLVEVLA